jgi:hypothetical protein
MKFRFSAFMMRAFLETKRKLRMQRQENRLSSFCNNYFEPSPFLVVLLMRVRILQRIFLGGISKRKIILV